MTKTLFRLALALWLFVLAPVAVQAQSLLSLGGSEPASVDTAGDMAEALKQAAEAGVSVVVLDDAGNLIGTASGKRTDSNETAQEDPMMEGASALMKAQAQVETFRETLRQRLDALPNSLNEVRFILRATSPDGRIMTYVEVLLWNIAFLFVGFLFARFIYGPKIAGRFVIPRVKENPQGYLEKMPFLVFRFSAGVVGTLLVLLTALILGALVAQYPDDLSIQFTVTAIFATFFIARTVSDLWRMILSPFLGQYRMPHFSDRDAQRLYYWASVLIAFNVVSIVFSTWIADFGLNYNVYALLHGTLTLVATIANIVMLVWNGRAITDAIRSGRAAVDVPWLTRVVSYAWAPVMIGYFIYGWLRLAFALVLERPIGIPPIAAAYSSFVAIIVVYGVINYAIEQYFARTRSRDALNEEMAEAEARETERGEPAPTRPRHAITTYEALARRVSGVLAFVAGIYALALIWGTDNRLMSNSVVGSALDVTVILFIGYIVYHLFRIWIDSRIAEETGDEEAGELGDEGGATGATRLATLLPLFRGAILAVVVVSVALIALLELGVNVSPLFAGAGVVGLAVGFGAQTLVRDIFSGAFFLFDDAFRKGEYIDLGEVKGTVEKISVRSFQLRHHLGALHTIPFGEIKTLSNYSRDWVIMKLPLRVTYDTDVEKVRKLIKKLGQELLSDPVIGENFIQPLKSQGVIEMQDSAMIIRVKFMTKPGDQWLVRKKVFEEIRELFAREGVKFAHREVTVRLAGDQDDTATPLQKKAALGAVQAAIDEDMLDGGGGGDLGGDDR
ncbi:MAG: mechanosensitive ion channel family protein [Antarcticimicrobium sp.]|uniref:mechanosensitive ion channel family protein n=1 Tax=Antarcticimicrobium sp. TaxID=2824147 RepID=UPI0026358E14|nr:mechanosensitive ion channel family protein [Antarcticimicrobium sp.]MDF1715912.1 mechanosensitive ion channel family protein [Antarcticimicrobium sp.]